MNPALSKNRSADRRKCGVNAIFVTGTDTGVGKTIVVSLLGQYLLERGYRVVTQKWVETGYRRHLGDVDIHLKFMKKERQHFGPFYSSMMPYAFRFASSPHLASRLEKRRIDVIKIKSSLNTLCAHFDYVIVEGTGGLLVPFSEKMLLVDIIEELKIPVLIVAGNRLGVINHTLLSIEALKSRKIKILGIVFDNISKGENEMILKDNPRIVKKLSGISVVAVLPWTDDPYQLQKQFMPLGDKILARL